MRQPHSELKVSFFDPSRIKLLVFDVDGTLTPEGQMVSLDIISQLSRIAQHRNVLLCTGRAFPLIQYIKTMLDQFTIPQVGHLCEYGSQYRDQTGNLVWNLTFSEPYVEELISCLDRTAKILFYNADLGGYVLYCPDEMQMELFAAKFERYNSQVFAVKTRDYDEFCGLMRKHQLSILRTSQQNLFPSTRDYLTLFGDTHRQIEVFFNTKHALWEVFPPKVSKGEMLRKLLAKLSITPQEVLFCGNEPTDESIFDIAGIYSVYVGIESTYQAKATWSVPHSDQLFIHLNRMFG